MLRGCPIVDCFDCKGAGFQSPEWQGVQYDEECPRCHGTGKIENIPNGD